MMIASFMCADGYDLRHRAAPDDASNLPRPDRGSGGRVGSAMKARLRGPDTNLPLRDHDEPVGKLIANPT